MVRAKTRTERHELLLTPEEKANWILKAQAVGMNLNEYIRSCVEKRKLSPALPPVNKVTAVELGRVGINLNQQIKAMNTALALGQKIPNIDEAMQRVEEVYKMLRMLQLDLLNNRLPKRKKSQLSGFGKAKQPSAKRTRK